MSDAAPLHERLEALSTQMYEKAWEIDPNAGLPWLREFASCVADFARQCEQEYVPLDDGGFPTIAQGVALAKFLRAEWSLDRPAGDRHASIARGGMGLPDSYVSVRLASGYEGGIDPEGSVST